MEMLTTLYQLRRLFSVKFTCRSRNIHLPQVHCVLDLSGLKETGVIHPDIRIYRLFVFLQTSEFLEDISLIDSRRTQYFVCFVHCIGRE